jgi:ribosome-binding protein aMBF1 (putative translation factor)
VLGKCEFCGRTIKGDPEIRIRRGKEHIYCSDFCFKMHFYDVPTITNEDLQKFYNLRCVSIKLD